MKTFVVNALVPVSFTVEAEDEENAIDRATTEKRYAMTSPDGEIVAMEREDIKSIEEQTE